MDCPDSEIGYDEQVARFVISKRWIRIANNSVKPDAFIPHPHIELSVTRHKNITTEKIWAHGESVAANRNKTLYGRADVRVGDVRKESIDVVARPIAGENPNHACLIDWPSEKSHQKQIAQEIVAKTHYVAREE